MAYSSARGMTLVEVIIALALLTIVAVGAVGAFTTLLTSNRANTASTQLQAATLQVMEGLEAVAYSQLESWNGASVIIGKVTCVISVSLAQTNLYQIEVTGTQPGRVGGTYTLVTLRSIR